MSLESIIAVQARGDEYLETQHERNPMIWLFYWLAVPFVYLIMIHAFWKLARGRR